MKDLAVQLASDGEGISKLMIIDVEGAADDAAARRIGLAIGNSPLVKTAVAGEDANWGASSWRSASLAKKRCAINYP